VRVLKEIALGHEQSGVTVVFVSHRFEVPPEVDKLAARFEIKLPDARALRDIVTDEARRHAKANPGVRVRAEPEAIEGLVRNLRGLAAQDARRLARQAIVDDHALTESDLPEVMAAKYRLLNRDGVLSFEYETAHFSDVGGMSRLKTWLAQRQAVFLAEEPPPGLDIPRGVLLLGVQGGGKSLAAKAVAGVWGVPLLRLDFGAVYNKFIGETERNLRDALELAEVMSPCVLWIDEVEKGVVADSGDGGVSQRVLGTLLTWMAEREQRVFIAMTANNIDALPPELVRKGRLDEIFFVDLPGPEAREAIFGIHLRKRALDPDGFDLGRLAALTEGYSGAEIEQAVVSALYRAHAGQSEPRQADVVGEVLNTRPLSVVMAEKIAWLRAWAGERTVPAD
jgi:SpoVK/Ycf46/Vps4 family AAA+-type ATPase